MEMEIARHDWTGMRCGCGDTAAHLVAELLQLTEDGDERASVQAGLEHHVWSSVVLWEPALAVTSVALAALAEDLEPAARLRFLDLLQYLVTGEGTDRESAAEGLDLPERCRSAATQGMWLLYQEVMSTRSPGLAGAAFEVLTVIEPDRARLARVREAAAEWLPVCCRTGLCDDDFDGGDRM
ncbi:hypothetical protein V2W30_38870 [Streptomyces sp. Q6]|uniref:Uncharacterized protein n=1 Tax=Streptomyces citrinus TaxID=3118173 RepID=A0ACD5ANF3_9ACTN